MTSKKEMFANIWVLLIGLLPTAIQFYRTGDVASLTVTGILLAIIPVYFIFDWITNKFGTIDALDKRVRKVEEKVDYMKDVHTLDKRVSFLEKSRKGAVNPKYIVLAVMTILFLLYLRVAGFI